MLSGHRAVTISSLHENSLESAGVRGRSKSLEAGSAFQRAIWRTLANYGQLLGRLNFTLAKADNEKRFQVELCCALPPTPG